MEYVDGQSINEYSLSTSSGKDLNDVFRKVISAFEYLEQSYILHRDIRPSNIMIDKNNNVKIIDFGFGKQLSCTKADKNSILLNWPATLMPEEIEFNQVYDERTEIYFVGTLFRYLLNDATSDFRFKHILEKMTRVSHIDRYGSFTDIVNDISAGVLGEIDFSTKEKTTYRNFADALATHIKNYIGSYSPINNIAVTLSRLDELLRCSSLEKYLQNNNHLINCFISNGFSYIASKDIEVQLIIDFYGLIIGLTPAKQKILFDNIYNRLSTIEVQIKYDDIPF